eukprot:906-Heterococcus_DN1.PRE.4
MSYIDTAAKLQSALIQAGRFFKGMLHSATCNTLGSVLESLSGLQDAKARTNETKLKALCISVNG